MSSIIAMALSSKSSEPIYLNDSFFETNRLFLFDLMQLNHYADWFLFYNMSKVCLISDPKAKGW